MAWGVGGWLLFPFLQKIGSARAQSCARGVAELKTTLPELHPGVSLQERLQLSQIRRSTPSAPPVKNI